MNILKYVLDIKDIQTIEIGDLYALPIAVAEQNGKLVMWAETSPPNNPPSSYIITVVIVATGYEKDYGLNQEKKIPYVGTVVMSNGLVWHVYALWSEKRS